MHILWPVFDFFANNKQARWIAAGIAGVFVFLSWQRLRDGRIRRQERKKIEAKAEKTATKVITKAQEKSHDVIEKADKARADIPRGTPSGELPDDIQDILFDD